MGRRCIVNRVMYVKCFLFWEFIFTVLEMYSRLFKVCVVSVIKVCLYPSRYLHLHPELSVKHQNCWFFQTLLNSWFHFSKHVLSNHTKVFGGLSRCLMYIDNPRSYLRSHLGSIVMIVFTCILMMHEMSVEGGEKFYFIVIYLMLYLFRF